MTKETKNLFALILIGIIIFCLSSCYSSLRTGYYKVESVRGNTVNFKGVLVTDEVKEKIYFAEHLLVNPSHTAAIEGKKEEWDILDKFIKEFKDEFKDENWDYLDFIADRVRAKYPINNINNLKP